MSESTNISPGLAAYQEQCERSIRFQVSNLQEHLDDTWRGVCRAGDFPGRHDVLAAVERAQRTLHKIRQLADADEASSA